MRLRPRKILVSLKESQEAIAHNPVFPESNETITIRALVTDASGIYSVTLHYSYNDGPWLTSSMSHASGDLYAIDIGPYNSGDQIKYFISALDDSPDHNEAIEDNSGSYYIINIGSDTTPGFNLRRFLIISCSLLGALFIFILYKRRRW